MRRQIKLIKNVFPKISALLIAVVLWVGFKTKNVDTPYEVEIKKWHQNRIEKLKTENGWLNLAGLFWVDEGVNTFGGNTENKIIFPKGTSDDFLGEITLKNGEVYFKNTKNVKILHNNDLVNEIRIYPYRENGKPTILEHKTLRWFIIKRGDKFAIRLRDLESPILKNFTGIETFKIDSTYKIQAKFIPTEGKKIAILDVTGQVSQQDSPGTLVFKLNGKEHRLDALSEGDELFIIFGDKTNKKETYGAGRFLYAQKPDNQGNVTLDFNKATNPPCAFTPYATCPLPPKQNQLSVEIKAGEKNYGHH
jgi:hypothetical protein